MAAAHAQGAHARTDMLAARRDGGRASFDRVARSEHARTGLWGWVMIMSQPTGSGSAVLSRWPSGKPYALACQLLELGEQWTTLSL